MSPIRESAANVSHAQTRADSGASRKPTALHRIAVSGGRLAIREWFDPANFDVRRPAVVLLHGFASASSAWDEIATRLTSTFRVLAPDLPGHGESEFRDTSTACTMESTVAFLRDALAHLGVDAFSLVGYSLGGRVALHCALDDSIRLVGLVLESASPGIDDDGERRSRRDADEELAEFIEASSIEAFVDRWERVPTLAKQASLPTAVRAELRARRLACSRPGLAASLRGMGTGAQLWLGGRLCEIHTPTLLITGAEDEKFTKIAQFMTARIAGSRCAAFPAAGHSVHLEYPDAYAEAVLAFAAGRECDIEKPASKMRRVGAEHG